MKTGRTHGILALVLAALLCAAVSGCAGTTAPGTATPAVTTAAPEQTAAPTPQAQDNSPVTFTCGISNQNCTIGDGTHQDYAVMAEITKQTGVTLDFVTYDAEKFKVLLAGGDLPNIYNLEGSSNTAIKTMIDSGMLLPLDDLLDQYGQNIKLNIPLALKWSKDIIGGGKTYFLPVCATISDKSNPIATGALNFLARYDIYKAIGSPVITDPEDGFLAVLKQMQDYQREKTGDQTIYALSTWYEWNLWPYIITYPFSNGFIDGNYNQEYNCETGEIESIFLKEDSSFWKGIKFFNKAYQMGIFDPEAMTTKFAQYGEKATNGKLLVVGAGWFVPDKELCGEDAIFEVLPGSAKYIPQLYGTDSPLGYGLTGARMINANCPKPERVMQLLNLFDTVDGARLLYNGVKGVEWDVVDGKPQLIGDYLAAVKAGKTNDYANARKLGVVAGDMKVDLGQFYTSTAIATTDGAPISLNSTLELKIEAATPAQKKYAQDFGADLVLPGQVYDKWVKEGKVQSPTTQPLAAKLMATPSDATMRVESKASEYFMANVSKVILAADDAAYNQAKADMIQAFKDMGLEVCDVEIQRLYSEAQAIVDSFAGK